MSTALIKEIVAERAKRVYRLCRYCARPCVGPACDEHRDLIALDPHYTLSRKEA